MVACESCGKAWNLYDIPDGICPACDADMTAEKKDLMKVLLAQGVFFDCDENGWILVSENTRNIAETHVTTQNSRQSAASKTTEKATPKPLQEKEKMAKPEKPAGIHFKGQFSEIEYYKHEVIQIPDEGKMIVLVYFHFKNLAGKPKCFFDCSSIKVFQHGIERESANYFIRKEYERNAIKEILPGYSLDIAHGFEIEDYSDVILKYKPWGSEESEEPFMQTLHLEEGESSDGFEMAFLENRLMDFMRDFIHEKLLQDNTYVRLMRQFEQEQTQKRGKEKPVKKSGRQRPAGRIVKPSAGRPIRAEEDFLDAALLVFYLNWMHDHLTKKDLEAAVQQMEERRREAEAPLEIVLDLSDLGYVNYEEPEGDDLDEDPDESDLLDDYDDGNWDMELADLDAESEFYEPPTDYEDDDAIALDMEEAIDDAIMFHGGNPFDWDTRSDFLNDPLGFGDDDDF